MATKLEQEIIDLLDNCSDPGDIHKYQQKLKRHMRSIQDMIATARTQVEALKIFEAALSTRINELKIS